MNTFLEKIRFLAKSFYFCSQFSNTNEVTLCIGHLN